jgi:hypothetical protein
MEPPTLYEGEEISETTTEYGGNYSIAGKIVQFKIAKISFL